MIILKRNILRWNRYVKQDLSILLDIKKKLIILGNVFLFLGAGYFIFTTR